MRFIGYHLPHRMHIYIHSQGIHSHTHGYPLASHLTSPIRVCNQLAHVVLNDMRSTRIGSQLHHTLNLYIYFFSWSLYIHIFTCLSLQPPSSPTWISSSAMVTRRRAMGASTHDPVALYPMRTWSLAVRHRTTKAIALVLPRAWAWAPVGLQAMAMAPVRVWVRAAVRAPTRYTRVYRMRRSATTAKQEASVASTRAASDGVPSQRRRMNWIWSKGMHSNTHSSTL